MVTLDLAGYSLTGTDAIQLWNSDKLTLKDSSPAKTGSVSAAERAIVLHDSSELTLESGTVNGVFIMTDATMVANGGTMNGSSTMEYASLVLGGTIRQDAGAAGTVFTGTVINFGTISGGVFSGTVINTGTITGGTFTGTVENGYDYGNGLVSGAITGGTFKGTVVDNDGTISGGLFYGGGAKSGIQGKVVTFMVGDTVYAREVVPSGGKAFAPADPASADGESFRCWQIVTGQRTGDWFLDEGGKWVATIEYEYGPYDFSQSVSEDITLYAAFGPEIYTISYSGLPEGTTPAYYGLPTEYTAETETFTLNGLTWDNHAFLGWTYEGQTTPVDSVTIEKGSTGARAYTAVWKELYAVTFDPNGGALAEADTVAFTVVDGTLALSSLPAPTRQGYAFDGWFTAATGGDPVTLATVFTAATTVYAHWTHQDHFGGKATCTDRPVCEECGNEYGEAINHANWKHIPAKAATTKAEGNIEHWYCPDCGRYFIRENDTLTEIQRSDTVIPKLRPESPKTGDESPLALWLGVMAACAVGVALTRKKKENS